MNLFIFVSMVYIFYILVFSLCVSHSYFFVVIMVIPCDTIVAVQYE